ncbi:hypothetical protein M426DRAFT_245157 [Hypoxylon sp. CI-4A]|nr:hypothetical protein M426DRAFT_245157 [Hypoxylon sp. CI-4A]
MSMSHTIQIYAELLSNIRKISVGCDLLTPSSSSTKATISPSGRVLTVCHDGAENTIVLPGRVASINSLPVLKLGSKNLSWRLPLAETPGHHAFSASDEQSVPWSASDLQLGASISCRTCGSTIVEPGDIKVWKDLPSENWAEMMEFWHCHKPSDHGHGHEHNDNLTSTKAYGASSRISAQRGVGFVDLTSFLIHDRDISHSNITFSPDSKDSIENEEYQNSETENSPVFCSCCKMQLGVSKDQDVSFSLFKWQVLVEVEEQANRSPNAPPSLFHCISAMLLATMSRSGSSRSIILPMTSKDQVFKDAPSLFHLWVLNGNITFSSTWETGSPLKAVKLFWCMISQNEADKLLDSMTSNVQDITLPEDAIERLSGILTETYNFLPKSDRQLKEWRVGLLEKWDGKGA